MSEDTAPNIEENQSPATPLDVAKKPADDVLDDSWVIVPELVTKDNITIVLAGKSGAGKSTLGKHIFELELNNKPSACSVTEEIVKKKIKRNDTTLDIIDTVGFTGSNRKKQLKDISKFTKGQADLLLYCLPVSPGSRFEDRNPEIMKSLHDAFGTSIWRHCIVVLTFSNLAWNYFAKSNKNTAATEYKKYIQGYVDEFTKELRKLRVKVSKITNVMEKVNGPSGSNSAEAADGNAVMGGEKSAEASGGNGGEKSESEEAAGGNGGEKSESEEASGGNGGEKSESEEASGGNGGEKSESEEASGGNGGEKSESAEATGGSGGEKSESEEAADGNGGEKSEATGAEKSESAEAANRKNSAESNRGIVFVPAGFERDDQILPGVQYKIKTQAREFTRQAKKVTPQPPDHLEVMQDTEVTTDNWADILVSEMLKSATPECGLGLLQFWWGRERIGTILKEKNLSIALGGGVAGGVVGGAVGLGGGATLGLIGGPIGIPIGAAFGLVTGIVAGTVIGGGSTSGGATLLGHGLEKTRKKNLSN